MKKFPQVDKQHIRLTYITHYYLNQKSPDAILDLLRKYESYPRDLLDVVQFVVVDDGSPLLFEIPDFNLNLTWLRIGEDIPWNQAGARNLGAVYAKSDKILLTDLDHEFPEYTLRWIVDMPEPGRRIYKPPRINSQGKRYGFHSNIFIMSRARFMRLYGYDEEYSGGYGAEDYRFVRFQKYHGSWMRVLPNKYFCVDRKWVDREAGYHSLNRDLSRNTPIDERKKNELLEFGPEAGHSRMFLNFPWEIVRDVHRSASVNRPSKRWWKHLWLFRTLFGSYV
ncbi:MAG: glycosyltransferase family A protein [Sulfuricellaceae bacterium]|nr:glycosyltransferase family A protein [Sulfuricellaceae bacterium]